MYIPLSVHHMVSHVKFSAIFFVYVRHPTEITYRRSHWSTYRVIEFSLNQIKCIKSKWSLKKPNHIESFSYFQQNCSNFVANNRNNKDAWCLIMINISYFIREFSQSETLIYIPHDITVSVSLICDFGERTNSENGIISGQLHSVTKMGQLTLPSVLACICVLVQVSVGYIEVIILLYFTDHCRIFLRSHSEWSRLSSMLNILKHS